nr:zinc finger, CCHC-type [Tanacetum cinerariifolium]
VAVNVYQRVDGYSFVTHRVSKLKDTIRGYSIRGRVDFKRWQKKMHFMLSSVSVVYGLTTPMPEDGGENPTVEQSRKRAK